MSAPVRMIGTGPLVDEGPLRPGVPGGFEPGGHVRVLLRRSCCSVRSASMSKSCQGCRAEDQLPFPVAHGLVSLVLPEDGLACGQAACQAKAGRRLTPCIGSMALPSNSRGYFAPAEIDGGGHDVDQVHRLFLQAAAALGGNARRPVRDERRADAALVREVLVAAERRVRQRRPIHPEHDIGLRPADRARRLA